MTLRISQATDVITVDHPVFLLIGQPGISKTSLAYSLANPLLIDFDHGAHRAVNRRATASVDSWADVVELTNPAFLEPYTSIAIDTVERCLGTMTIAILAESPKNGTSAGTLNQKGWGLLKARFALWLATLRSYGKDILLLAHAKEERNGEQRTVRADIPGGSYGEVMKIADFVGYLSMRGNDRVLDFNPTDAWIGKNPAGWPPMLLPPAARAGAFMADLFDRGRAALGQQTAASAAVAVGVERWREAIARYVSAAQFNAGLAEMRGLKAGEPVLYAQVHALLSRASKVGGMRYDVDLCAFVEVPAAERVALRPPVHRPARVATVQPQLLSALTTTGGVQ